MVESSLWDIPEQTTPEEAEYPAERSPDGRFLRVSPNQYRGAKVEAMHAEVSVALDVENGREVMWHSVPLKYLAEADMPRFNQNLRQFASLHHPHLINYVTHWQSASSLVLVTERLPELSLRDYLQKIKAPRLKVIKTWCRHLLEVLEYLHGARPFPVLVQRLSLDDLYCAESSGQIKLSLFENYFLPASASRQLLSRHYEYLSPEQLRDEVSPSIDIYSLGLCLLEICTQTSPYDECQTPLEKSRKIMAGKKPRALSRIVNEDVREFIELCLVHKEERPSAAQLLQHAFLSECSDDSCSKPVQLSAKHEGFPSPVSSTTIELDMFLPHSHPRVPRRIEFPFDLNSDTPESVAEEMVEEFNLPQEFTPTLCRKISSAIWGRNKENASTEARSSEGEEDSCETLQAQKSISSHSSTDQCSRCFLSKYSASNSPADVKSLQFALQGLYSLGSKADGVFDKKTESLVRRFQDDCGLEATGVVTKELWRKAKWQWDTENEEKV